MSRSHRRAPVHGITTARSEKEDKRALNRAWRSRARAALGAARRLGEAALDALVLPESHDDVMSVWSMAKDGRQANWGRGDGPRACRRGFRRWHSDRAARWPAWKFWGK